MTLCAVCGFSGAAEKAAKEDPQISCPSAPRRVVPRLIRIIERSEPGFTEGLIYRDGVLYESTGLYGQSRMQKIDPATGKVTRLADLPPEFFGEGLAFWNGEFLQLTWHEGEIFFWRGEPAGGAVDTLSPSARQKYPRGLSEGWGLASIADGLVASDGSDRLYFFDPGRSQPAKILNVRKGKLPVKGLNELEVRDSRILANIYPSRRIVSIDRDTGCVMEEVDLGPILSRVSARTVIPQDTESVLNGIAALPEPGRFILAGKNWPVLLEVDLKSIFAD